MSLVGLEIEGAVATLGDGVFFANRIDDAFAVVETGTPGLLVLRENRTVARTDSAGRALVPGLRSFESNRIAIDPRDAPVNAEIATAERVVVPAERAGVRVDMGVRRDAGSAVVVFATAAGAPVAAGAATTTRRPRRTTSRWRDSETSTVTRVRSVRSRRSGTHPALPPARYGTARRPKRPSGDTRWIQATVGVP
jgi:outer membrane usher protein FimD/PapC